MQLYFFSFPSSLLFFSQERFGKFFALILFQSFVSSRNSTHLNIIACAGHEIVFQKRTLIEFLNGYMIFLCVYIYIFFPCNLILWKHLSLFKQHPHVRQLGLVTSPVWWEEMTNTAELSPEEKKDLFPLPVAWGLRFFHHLKVLMKVY